MRKVEWCYTFKGWYRTINREKKRQRARCAYLTYCICPWVLPSMCPTKICQITCKYIRARRLLKAWRWWRKRHLRSVSVAIAVPCPKVNPSAKIVSHNPLRLLVANYFCYSAGKSSSWAEVFTLKAFAELCKSCDQRSVFWGPHIF